VRDEPDQLGITSVGGVAVDRDCSLVKLPVEDLERVVWLFTP